MRMFEAVLIGVNLLSLGLSLRKQPRKVWLGIAGGNVLAFLLHALFEGLRYQMAFSYILVALLTIPVLFDSHSPKLFKIVAVSLSVVCLGMTSFLAYALPVFTLPKPTGSYAVGVQYFHLTDEHRVDPFLGGSTQKRELMVKVYYPAQQDDTKPDAPYFHGSPALIRSFVAFYHLPAFAFDHLRLVQTHAKENLDVSDQQPRYPVVLFSHGAGTTMEVQVSQSEDLASHGYIVVDIDHTYVSAATAFPDRMVSHHAATTDFATPEPAEIISQIMADDASFVIDTLEDMNEGRMESRFRGRLDVEHIGAMGHSMGGAAAYNLAIQDTRVDAAIDLDGVVYTTPHGQEVAPFLMLANDQYHVQAIAGGTPLMKRFDDMEEVDKKITLEMFGSREVYDAAYNRAQQNVIGLTEVLKPSGALFTIAGSDHMKFTDIGLFLGVRQLRELIDIRGKTDPARCLEITQALTLAFFDRHLKSKPDIFEALLKRYPELKQVGLQ